MKINAQTLSQLLGLINYYADYPFPGARLEIAPEIQDSVYKHLEKLHKQLKSGGEPNPDKVETSIRTLYGLIWEPMKKAAESHHTQLKKLIEPHQTQRQRIFELIISFENDLFSAFEDTGISPNRCKNSKQ